MVVSMASMSSFTICQRRYKRLFETQSLLIMDTLGMIILSIIERLSSFRGKKLVCRLVHWKVSFIQRCPLFRVSFIRGSTTYVHMYTCIHVHMYVVISPELHSISAGGCQGYVVVPPGLPHHDQSDRGIHCGLSHRHSRGLKYQQIFPVEWTSCVM